MASSALVQIPGLGPSLGSYLQRPADAVKTPKKAKAQTEVTLPQAAREAGQGQAGGAAVTLAKASELHVKDSAKQGAYQKADAPAVAAPSTAPGPALIVEVVDKGGNKMLRQQRSTAGCRETSRSNASFTSDSAFVSIDHRAPPDLDPNGNSRQALRTAPTQATMWQPLSFLAGAAWHAFACSGSIA
ncbi:MAG: hypothetical protein WDW36_000902 [Sanguina aurantia]